MTFNPKMMILAREAAGLTQSSLAHLVGASQARVSKVENGFEDPPGLLLERIAAQCDVPVEFLRQPDQPLGEGVVDFYHKKRVTLPAKPLKRAQALANVVRFEAVRLLGNVDLEDVAPFPTFSVSEYGPPEEVAHLVRAAWRVAPGPLPDLIALIEAAAVPVFLESLGHEKLFAISMPGIAGRHVVVLNADLPPSAQRFALAHELGHLVMHEGLEDIQAMERQADEFAAALLMPASDFRPQLRGPRLQLRDVGALKPVWRVSLAAMIRRARDLAVISERHYRTLNVQLSNLPSGRKREPGEFAADVPKLMKHVLLHHRNEFGYSIDELSKVLVCTSDSLRVRYLEERPPLRGVGIAGDKRRLSVAHIG